MARTIGDAAVASAIPNRLKAWWLYRMLFSPDPLGERLTLMWHNHFATSNRKVQDLVLMREQNELLREHARASVRRTAAGGRETSGDARVARCRRQPQRPAERKPGPRDAGTLHAGRRQLHRERRASGGPALTGWAVVDGRFGFREARHDGERKDVSRTRPAQLDGDDLLSDLARTSGDREAHSPGESAARSWVKQPSTKRNSSRWPRACASRNLDIGWAVETVLRSQLFFGDAALNSRVAGPVEWAVGAVRRWNSPIRRRARCCWPSGRRAWARTCSTRPTWAAGRKAARGSARRSVVARANFAAALVEGRLWHPTACTRSVASSSSVIAKRTTCPKPSRWFTELLWGRRRIRLPLRKLSPPSDSIKQDDRLATAVALAIGPTRKSAQLTKRSFIMLSRREFLHRTSLVSLWPRRAVAVRSDRPRGRRRQPTPARSSSFSSTAATTASTPSCHSATMPMVAIAMRFDSKPTSSTNSTTTSAFIRK